MSALKNPETSSFTTTISDQQSSLCCAEKTGLQSFGIGQGLIEHPPTECGILARKHPLPIGIMQ